MPGVYMPFEVLKIVYHKTGFFRTIMWLLTLSLNCPPSPLVQAQRVDSLFYSNQVTEGGSVNG